MIAETVAAAGRNHIRPSGDPPSASRRAWASLRGQDGQPLTASSRDPRTRPRYCDAVAGWQQAEGDGHRPEVLTAFGPDHTPVQGTPAVSHGAHGRRRWVDVLRFLTAWALVVPLALWLVVRATGVGAGTWIETFIVFTPFVALASVVVLAVVAVLRVWPAVLTAAGCCIGFGMLMAPLFVRGPQPSPSPDGPSLRVMTANVQFGLADAAVVVRLLREEEIEVLGVQELTPAFHEALVAEGIEDLLPHGLVDARPGASGTGLYSRHPVERVDHDVAGEHENPTGLVDVPDARPVQVTVVHPVPPVLDGGLTDWRRTFRSLPRPGNSGPVHLLIGDFNATVDQPTMRALLDDGYVDAAGAEGRGWEATWRARRLGPGLTIDHVLVDRSTDVDGVSVHGVPGSDHRAVVAELRLPRG